MTDLRHLPLPLYLRRLDELRSTPKRPSLLSRLINTFKESRHAA